MVLEADIAVIGAGPAGLTAALAARSAGAEVVVIDEYPEAGGQFFRQVSSEFRVANRAQLGKDYTKGDVLLRAVREAGVKHLADTLVWGSFGAGEVSLSRRGEVMSLRSRRIIVATGAHERSLPFPGWDLPGVITPGAAQTLVKHQQTLPGERIVLSGSGPFLLAVASTLLSAGGRLSLMAEATRPWEWFPHAVKAAGHWARMREALQYFGALASSRVPVSFGTVVVRAEGDERLERVVLMKCDREGSVLAGTERAVPADALCIGYGFVPSVHLTRMLGCRHIYNAGRGGWIPEHDDDLRTSVPNVLVAGETAGIGGAHAAMAEGELAGLVAAQDLGLWVDPTKVKAARTRRARHRRFADVMNDLFACKPGLENLIGDDVLICRCEEVTAGAIRDAARPWAPDVNFVKGVTRCGMGLCQGRVCETAVASILARKLGSTVDAVGAFRSRLPLKPVSLGAMEAIEAEDP